MSHAYAVNSSQTLSRRVSAVVQRLGESKVTVEPAVLDAMARTTDLHIHQPICVVHATSVEDVQALVATACEEKLSIFACSGGKNWGYGTHGLGASDAVLLNLERMNRIIEVNETLGYAVVEPGVTYRQLNEYLKDRHPGLWADCTDGPPDGSVIGNALDKGIGFTPYGDHFGQLCGMEVVLPTGEVLRTGGGADELFHARHVYKWGIGPVVDGLFAQSNFGIVTRAGMRLMPKPEAFVFFAFDLRSNEQLPQFIDTLRELKLRDVFQSTSVIPSRQAVTAAIAGVGLPDAKAQAHFHGIACWSCCGGIYGHRELVRARQKILKRELSPLGTIRFFSASRQRSMARVLNYVAPRPTLRACAQWLSRTLLGKSTAMLEAGAALSQVLKGEPTERFLRLAYFRGSVSCPEQGRDPARDGCGFMWLAPMVPLTGEHVNSVLAIVNKHFVEADRNLVSAFHIHNDRCATLLLGIFFDKQSEFEIEQADMTYRQLSAELLHAGYPSYRATTSQQAAVLEAAPALRNFVTRLKHAVDPNGVLAPGRYGIR